MQVCDSVRQKKNVVLHNTRIRLPLHGIKDDFTSAQHNMWLHDMKVKVKLHMTRRKRMQLHVTPLDQWLNMTRM